MGLGYPRIDIGLFGLGTGHYAFFLSFFLHSSCIRDITVETYDYHEVGLRMLRLRVLIGISSLQFYNALFL